MKELLYVDKTYSIWSSVVSHKNNTTLTFFKDYIKKHFIFFVIEKSYSFPRINPTFMFI